jgi:dGTPase
VRVLFAAYADAPRQLPDEHRIAHEHIGLRAVADYIAGMTDRFASREYTRLCGRSAFGDA